MTIASKPHILFLWRIFLRLGSSSSCCAGSYQGIFFSISVLFGVPWKGIAILYIQAFYARAFLTIILGFCDNFDTTHCKVASLPTGIETLAIGATETASAFDPEIKQTKNVDFSLIKLLLTQTLYLI